MRLREAVRVLVLGKGRDRQILTATDLRRLFPGDSPAALKKGIAHLGGIGLLSRVTHGVYLNMAAPHMGLEAAGRLVAHIRPRDLSYLSYESALSWHGAINPIPYIESFATTGRRGRFSTPAARIELSHTRREPNEILARTLFRDDLRCRVASPDLALEDQLRVRPDVAGCYVEAVYMEEARACWREMGGTH